MQRAAAAAAGPREQCIGRLGTLLAGVGQALAHHLTIEADRRRLMIAALRYIDTFVKVDGEWLFAERLLYVDWTEEHAGLPRRIERRRRVASARRWPCGEGL